MKMPRLHNKHRGTAPPGAVYIGRGSPWGNPFRMGIDGDRARVVRRFEIDVLPNLDVRSLAGRDLVCFCVLQPWAVGDPVVIECHGISIMKKANQR